MNKAAIRMIAVGSVMLVGVVATCPAADTALRETSEVISVLKSNYVDREKLDEKVINEATVSGILSSLGRGAVIISTNAELRNEPESTNATAAKVYGPLARAEVIDPEIGYIRLTDISEATVPALDSQLKGFANAKVKGLVLDLRYASGTNFDAAAAVASRFLGENQQLFTLKSSGKGAQVFRTTLDPKIAAENSGLTSEPVMLLVNEETRGSAEVLAGALRAQDRGIVIGSTTAGSAAAWRDVKLSDGRTLRLATAKIELPKSDVDSTNMELFPNGITPDVAVKIDPKTEHEAVFAVQTNETLTASLQPRLKRRGLTEAQLVKAFHGQALDPEDPATEKDKEAEQDSDIRQVHDIVLQRAVDILKGIRVLLSSQ